VCGADEKEENEKKTLGQPEAFNLSLPLSYFLSVLLAFFLLFILKRVFMPMHCYCRLWASNPGLTWLYYAAGGHIVSFVQAYSTKKYHLLLFFHVLPVNQPAIRGVDLCHKNFGRR